jgi:hypothetical protein
MDCGLPLSHKHEDCAHSFEEWDEIHAAQPPHRKIARSLRFGFARFVRNPLDRSVGRQWRRVTRAYRMLRDGVDPNGWWNHDIEASRMAWRHLETMAKDGHGCPGRWGCEKCLAYEGKPDTPSPWNCDCKPFDRWKEALLDMAFFHKVNAHEMPERKHSYKSSRAIGDRKDGETITYMAPPEFNDLSSDEQRRYRRGKLLYFRWFESLWD